MTRIGPLRTIILLALTTQVTCQFVDFFNAFLQPYQNVKQTVTKRPTNKQTRRYEDNIFFQNTDRPRNLDPFGFYPTTAKPRKTTRKTTTKTWYEITTEKAKKVNLINSNIHFVDNTNNKHVENNNNRRTDNNNNNRRTNNDNNRKVVNTNYEFNNAFDFSGFNNNRKTTTKRPYSSNLSAGSIITFPNSYTTQNPLLNRPGVKPAVVDDNKPPITNRPVTNRPIYFPNEGPKWPETTKRPEATKRPIFTSITERPDDNRNNNNKPDNNDSNNNNRPDNNSNNRPGPDDGEEPDIEVGPDEDDMSDAEKQRYLQIAEQKCNEFKSLNVKKVVALPLAPSNHGVEVNVSTCAPTNVPLIIGGKVVSINEFPHMGLVGWKKIQKPGYSWKCGASLISEQYMLTAGHCTYHDKDYNVVSGPPQAIQLGSSYFDDPAGTVVRVAAVVRHAKYKLRRSYHDVALIRLTTVVTFSEMITPACLGVAPRVGEPIIATGWGKTEFGGDSSFELRSVSLPIWDMGDCREIWGTSRKLPNGVSPDSQMCAGERRGGKDTCQGDSGGPAQVQDGCVWRIVAVTSVGRSCGAPDTPALYARIPRAFIASQAFSDVSINNNDDNNRYNGNNNGYNVNNNGYNGNNNQNNANNNVYSVNNNQNTGNNANDNRFNVNNNQNNPNNNGYNNQNVNIHNNGASLPNIGINYNTNDYNHNNNNNYDNSYTIIPSINNPYNNDNKNDIIRPVIQNYDTQYSGNNQNNNWSNNNFNNPNTHNDYNAYTTHNYNDYNNRNGHYESPIINTYNNNNGNNRFPVISSKPWWSV